MAQKSHPKRGSRGYWPRKRIPDLTPRFSSWPELGPESSPRLQGFAGYKAGMTHAIIRNTNKDSVTADQEIQTPVTVLEVPPMRVAAVRFYSGGPYGLRCMTEIWADKLDKSLERLLTIETGGRESPREAPEGGGEKHGKGKKGGGGKSEGLSEELEAKFKGLDISRVEEVRVLVHTQPELVTGIPKKVPDLMEVRVGGGTIPQRVEYAKSLLGKEVRVSDFAEEGKVVDVAGITKGKGFAGTIKRWHPKLLSHKNSKHRRLVGTLGPHFPSYVQRTVPQAGQLGLHQRTEFNKLILRIGEKGDEVNPAGGFLNYGLVRNSYVLIQGSVPGCAKRLVKLRDAIRYIGPPPGKPEVLYISKESKQGS
ncbi:MAG: 50S ribosomal protein L3 [Thermoplasmata archaeon]